jgi:predicted DsbA family dithiol-disulfide isomerase
VEFADFECPFCRMLHGTLKKLNEEYAGRVHFVRLNMPLTSHPRALDAARAFVCADEQGKGEIFGDMLFEEELLGKGAQRLAAQRIGLDLDHFRKCLASPATDARINREAKVLRDIGFDGLPTTYVGARRIVGAQPEEVFRDAYSRAAQGGGGGGIPWYVYVMGSLGIAGALVWFGQKQQNGGAASGEAGA